ncbi:lysylphosphatidylglycerol synthase domain-containing protein [Mariniflexile gromovii]|uniref:lysylphosphatidylglycerol synthase domain-containing protein n=1 Tax=Mariniflexile gromovii TaxID=362523 RepID=UPI00293D982A|nr:lysylphosphatidylglycerol synthase domain-containing protein [Mariniflexile gromovii]
MLIKISIVVAAFYFIYIKLTQNTDFDYPIFFDFSTKNNLFSIKIMLFLLVLTGFNWFFEILKWQKLTASVKKISFKNALEQSLGSLTASLFTPNRIGEYGAKAIYYTKDYRKRIMLINLLSNVLQMGVTCILGVVGFSFFVSKYPISINYSKILLLSILTVFLIGFAIFILSKTKFRIKGFSFEKIKTFILNFPKKLIVYGFCFSLLRYAFFSFQFYYLLTVFGINISYLQAMMVISTMYLLASILPSIFIFDVVIKGSVAVYLFSFLGINTLTVLSIVTVMWFFNFVLPSIMGSYFVLNFNFPKD